MPDLNKEQQEYQKRLVNVFKEKNWNEMEAIMDEIRESKTLPENTLATIAKDNHDIRDMVIATYESNLVNRRPKDEEGYFKEYFDFVVKTVDDHYACFKHIRHVAPHLQRQYFALECQRRENEINWVKTKREDKAVENNSKKKDEVNVTHDKKRKEI